MRLCNVSVNFCAFSVILCVIKLLHKDTQRYTEVFQDKTRISWPKTGAWKICLRRATCDETGNRFLTSFGMTGVSWEKRRVGQDAAAKPPHPDQLSIISKAWCHSERSEESVSNWELRIVNFQFSILNSHLTSGFCGSLNASPLVVNRWGKWLGAKLHDADEKPGVPLHQLPLFEPL